MAWVVYDQLCRRVEAELEVGAAVLELTTLAAWGCSGLFSPRAAYVQVGAMLGTIMVANVFFVIIPAHRDLIRAKEEHRAPDPASALEAKRRSVHNNYLTLPVVFAMLSNHFPSAYGHSYAWIVLVALMLIGAWIRHFFNLRHAGRTVWWIPASALVAALALAVAMRPDEGGSVPAGPAVSDAQGQSIVQQRCVPCHSQTPSEPGFSAPPAGITFDTLDEIKSHADAIEEQAVRSKSMPLGNATGMTDEERNVLALWFTRGAPVE